MGVFSRSVLVGLDADQCQSQLGVEPDHANVNFVTGFKTHFDHIRTRTSIASSRTQSTTAQAQRKFACVKFERRGPDPKVSMESLRVNVAFGDCPDIPINALRDVTTDILNGATNEFFGT